MLIGRVHLSIVAPARPSSVPRAIPAAGAITLGTIVEFWSVVTHPAITGRPSTATEALGFIESLVATGGAEIWMPGPGFARRLMQAATALKVAGPRIFDLQISLTAFENGAHELWTNDFHFQSIPGLGVKNPIET